MNKYCIFMVVNDNFAIGAIITLYSFLKNNPWFDGDIIIGCGYDDGWGLSDENKEKLTNLYYKLQIVELKFSDFYDIFDNLRPIAQGGVGFEMTVYKFHAFRLRDYERVVVFDADMLIVNNIKELFEKDIEFGALYEVKNEDFSSDVYKLRENEYFNVGIMVIGKKYLNEETIIKCDNLLKSPETFEKSKIPHYGGLYPEQDILNVLTENEDVILIPRIYSADRFFCDEKDYRDVKIIHYLKYLKPWKYTDYDGWTQSEWMKYYNDYNDWLTNYTLILGENIIKYPKRYEDKDKYMVITCAKNENDYIREWIQHYLNLGFDKIIICDNNDDNSLLEVISDYIENGFVEVFDCRGFKIFQSHIVSMFCKEGNYKWCAYFDCDEFLELTTHSDIKTYLNEKEGDCIAFNWVMFDSNGQLKYEKTLLQERFAQPFYPLMNIENSFVKCIMRGGHLKYSDIENCGGHMFICDNREKILYNLGGYYLTKMDGDNLQSSLPLRYKEGYIKHYYTKSFEEWHNKATRGWPDRIGTLDVTRFFRLFNMEKPKREKYRESLFIDKEKFIQINDCPIDDDTRFFIFENTSDYVYAFLVRVMYVMSTKENGVFIIMGKEISDDMYNFLLECSFVTNNKLALVRDESEIERVFHKYGDKNSIINYWKKEI